jgi:hypothetical protein
VNAPVVGSLTPAERMQYLADVEQFGSRVADWFVSEARGWSALYDMLYWAEIRKQAVSFKEPGYWEAA